MIHEFANRSTRHGLTDLGRRQAAELVPGLGGRGITAVESSPLLRARQTAEILSAGLGVPMSVREELREFDVGEWEGRTDQPTWRIYHGILDSWLTHDDPTPVIPGGETRPQIVARLGRYVGEVLDPEADGAIAVVAHGGLFRVGLPGVVTNVPWPFTKTAPLANCGIVEVRWTPDGPRCVSWCGVDP